MQKAIDASLNNKNNSENNSENTADLSSNATAADENINNLSEDETVMVSIQADEYDKLLSELDQYKEKMAEYIDENQQLKTKLNEVNDLLDKRLFEISELTFEKSKLEAMLNGKIDNSNTSNNFDANSNKKQNKTPNRKVLYNSRNKNIVNLNGYSFWT